MHKFICLFLISIQAMAVVPVIDEHQLSTDITTMTSYGTTLGAYLSRLGQVMTAAQQVQQLHGLEQVSKAGTAICDLCSPVETIQLQTYVEQVNRDLCSQFSWSMKNITGLSQSVQDINDVVSLLQTNPKAAGLALQQAAIRTQVASQNTLAQIQLLMAQQSQKQLAEQKLEQQNTAATYAGFKQSGL